VGREDKKEREGTEFVAIHWARVRQIEELNRWAVLDFV
jgi:hypothetical protein